MPDIREYFPNYAALVEHKNIGIEKLPRSVSEFIGSVWLNLTFQDVLMFPGVGKTPVLLAQHFRHERNN